MSAAVSRLSAWHILHGHTKMNHCIRITDIENRFDSDAFFERIHVKKDSKRAEKIIKVIEKAKDSIHPVAIYCPSEVVLLDESRFSVEGITFECQSVLNRLKGVGKVFPNIVSCGLEIEAYCKEQDRLLEQYVTMELCNYSCELARKAIFDDLKTNFGLNEMIEIFPGEEEWSLQDGIRIFEIFEEETKALGLEITDRGIPIPGRTAYGFIIGK